MITADRYGISIAPDLLMGFLLGLFLIGIFFTVVLPYLQERKTNPAAKLSIDWFSTGITLLVIVAGWFAFKKFGVDKVNIRF